MALGVALVLAEAPAPFDRAVFRQTPLNRRAMIPDFTDRKVRDTVVMIGDRCDGVVPILHLAATVHVRR